MQKDLTISVETQKLLEKLFNLASPESVILKNLEGHINNLVEVAEQLRYAEEELSTKKTELEELLNFYKTVGKIWSDKVEELATLNKENPELDKLQKAIGSKMSIEHEKYSVNVELKNLISSTTREIESLRSELKKIRSQIHSSEETIKFLHEANAKVIEQQDTLNEYITRSKEGDLTLTRKEIEPFLKSFRLLNFSAENNQINEGKTVMLPSEISAISAELIFGDNITKFVIQTEKTPIGEIVEFDATQDVPEDYVPEETIEKKPEIILEEAKIETMKSDDQEKALEDPKDKIEELAEMFSASSADFIDITPEIDILEEVIDQPINESAIDQISALLIKECVEANMPKELRALKEKEYKFVAKKIIEEDLYTVEFLTEAIDILKNNKVDLTAVAPRSFLSNILNLVPNIKIINEQVGDMSEKSKRNNSAILAAAEPEHLKESIELSVPENLKDKHGQPDITSCIMFHPGLATMLSDLTENQTSGSRGL